MKTTVKHFAQFKATFRRYVKMFGLTGYHLFFKHGSAPETVASLTWDQDAMYATAQLASKLEDGMLTTKEFNPSKEAKHEAIHLLTCELADLAYSRFATRQQIDTAWESLVHKLESIIS